MWIDYCRDRAITLIENRLPGQRQEIARDQAVGSSHTGDLRKPKNTHPLIAFAIFSIQSANAIHGPVLPTGMAINSITIENRPATKVAR